MIINRVNSERCFVELFHGKYIYQMDDKYVKMLEKIYGRRLDKKCYVECFQSFKTDKTDIIIKIGDEKKYINVQNGRNRSIHMEPVSEFKRFLQSQNFPEELIDIYEDYHYAVEIDGKRLSLLEYQEKHQKEIDRFNAFANQKEILENVINRFFFSGIHNYNNPVDAVFYGRFKEFVCVTRDEIIDYLMTSNIEFDSIHFGPFTLQPWARNLNNNPLHEYRRDYIQVKWHRLNQGFHEIIKKNSPNNRE